MLGRFPSNNHCPIEITPVLILSDFVLILAAIASTKQSFTPAVLTYLLWLVARFVVLGLVPSLFEPVNQAYRLLEIEFVVVQVIFFCGLVLGTAFGRPKSP